VVVAKISDEEERIETPSTTSKFLHEEKVNVASLVQRPESGSFDFRTLHSGNKQGVNMATPVTAKADAAAESTSKLSSSEGSKGWPFEQPIRPRDFKSREDR